jgi:2-polyprenyl-6-methoxyphenol hydroxylase-like FAD-dependent oxidoreductase
LNHDSPLHLKLAPVEVDGALWYDRRTPMKALVVGAGIGGLTSALALRRAGIDVSVFERAADVAGVQLGGGIHLWPNGMRGLQEAGVADQVEALGGRAAAVQEAEFTTVTGRLLARWPLAELEQQVGAPTVGVVRPQLHRVLLGAMEPGVLRLGATFERFDEDGGSVVAHFADGSEERGDVLVGADGLRSAVRAQLKGAEELHYAGYSSWQGFAEYEDERAPVGLFRVVFGRGARFLHYHVAANRIYWEGIFATPPAQNDPPAGRKDAALARFAGWRSPIEAIIGATEASGINRTDIYVRPPLSSWGTGRVTLLGDAAHPMTNAMGQGANQAIEDAIVLANALAANGDAEASLRVYEQRRIGRTRGMVRVSALMSKLSRVQTPGIVAARNGWLRFSLSTFVYRKMRRDMAYRF